MTDTCPILVLNGKKPSRSETKAFINALSDPTILKSNGGYLFKSCRIQDTVHIGITPAISEGTRLHHYDIEIPESDSLLGSVSPHGEFMLLFRADGKLLNEQIRQQWRNQFIYFAKALLCRGYSGNGELDWITRQIIAESGIFETVPKTLKEILEYPGEKP